MEEADAPSLKIWHINKVYKAVKCHNFADYRDAYEAEFC